MLDNIVAFATDNVSLNSVSPATDNVLDNIDVCVDNMKHRQYRLLRRIGYSMCLRVPDR